MERFVGVLLCLVMLTSVYLTPTTSKESEEIVLTKDGNAYLDNRIEQVEIRYLTDKDFEKLYTCKPDIRYECGAIINIDQADAWLLMQIAVAEDNTDVESQSLIMSVILNRVKSEDFPNTIREVIYQEGQFAPVDDGRFNKAVPDINSHLALAEIEMGNVQSDYLYFESMKCSDTWQAKNRGTPYEYGSTRYYK